jgi:hypothetical protein
MSTVGFLQFEIRKYLLDENAANAFLVINSKQVICREDRV